MDNRKEKKNSTCTRDKWWIFSHNGVHQCPNIWMLRSRKALELIQSVWNKRLISFCKKYLILLSCTKCPFNGFIMVIIFWDVSLSQELKKINNNIFLESSRDRPQNRVWLFDIVEWRISCYLLVYIYWHYVGSRRRPRKGIHTNALPITILSY